ncbi:FHA domain-containing protein [Streptomyces xanthochromogenes]|uniref:FHA domain-containing protein n=1 Tax=Streptomyces xanthochromogenes TaxID=67384 RepID=UPI0039C86AFE
MQIRLTVLAPRSGHAVARACDVLVTAPAGTALAAVASGLASAASGAEVSGASVVLYAGRERLDAQRRILGEPPLVDGAVLSLGSPAQDEPAHDGPAPARLHVVAGPDAGGVHLLHGGRIGIGRSTESDVPLDDPDVSRQHCEVTVGTDGRVAVSDLNSTNGTRLDGREIGAKPVRFAPGALLRIGESALRLATGGPATEPSLTTVPDGEGHLRIAPDTAPASTPGAQQASPCRAVERPVRRSRPHLRHHPARRFPFIPLLPHFPHFLRYARHLHTALRYLHGSRRTPGAVRGLRRPRGAGRVRPRRSGRPARAGSAEQTAGHPDPRHAAARRASGARRGAAHPGRSGRRRPSARRDRGVGEAPGRGGATRQSPSSRAPSSRASRPSPPPRAGPIRPPSC